MKSSLVISAGIVALVLASQSTMLAATPVNIYQDMESGNDGDLLTPAIMNASSHGGSTWSIKGEMWSSTDGTANLPGPITVGGVTYAGTGGTRSWAFSDSNANNFVSCSLPGMHAKITVACFYTPCVTIKFWNQFDTIIMSGDKGFAVLQTTKEDAKGPYIRAHSCTPGWKTTFSPDHIPVTAGKTYWVNLHFDGAAGKTSVAVFDPASNFAQVGTTVVAEATEGTMKRRSTSAAATTTATIPPPNRGAFSTRSSSTIPTARSRWCPRATRRRRRRKSSRPSRDTPPGPVSIFVAKAPSRRRRGQSHFR